MKKILRLIFSLVGVVFLIEISCGCSAAAVNNIGSTSVYKIGILTPAVEHGWVAAVPYYAEQRCKELNNQVEYKLFTAADSAEMASQLDELMAWGCDAIVAFPQWKGLEEPLQAVINQGVVVVNCDIQMNVNGIYSVIGDNNGMGSQSAQYIVDKIGKKGNVVLMDVSTEDSATEERKNAFVERMTKIAPDMNRIDCETTLTREAAQQDFTELLATYTKIDAVYSMDDETSIGVLQAIKKAKRTDIKVVTGGGGSQEYFELMSKNKKIWLQSALYSPSMAKDAVDTAVSVLKGQKIAPSRIIATSIVDRNNYEKYLDEDSPY
ncbi:substrate-binding domain-containing protein [Clostridium aminobutyricum]|uniref:Substrate-binding domain-containing protein n=1 Tax=Clostridium aminobutyricum TaxID=33953 RepID=A0A939IJA3_CLOAM|nr:substrate-binding domain-containing protein [Clostridium aminobutyricum]MBN7773369.1 substrate-binding domain-containing protein [Clostridium aminobutyricum]